MATVQRMIVKYLTHYGLFNVGESAGLPKPEADRLVAAGIARLVGPAKEREPRVDAGTPKKPA